jgi:hypothetical protein
MSELLQSTFQPQQIVCIEHQEKCLFAETIQIMPERQRCWAKCLALGAWQAEERHWQLLYDLRDSPQLILPIALFRAALDTEIMPLLTELWQMEAAAKSIDPDLAARQALQQFIRSIPFS